ncbi:MAG TPA: 50S ribosomal protein L11 methyltransferase, partial [Acidimicrobiales bacterium]|nr:50S ribosomal protein L11 methyltransferase [Acidimicrobiales bacterium]
MSAGSDLTHLTRPALVPELVLRLADELVPVWEAAVSEDPARGEDPPFWAFAWAGGQAVARYLLDHPDVVAGRPVVDVGCGSGLCAVAAARAGAGPVTAVDVDPRCGRVVAANAAANGVTVGFRVADVRGEAPPAGGVVIAGDVMYEASVAGSLRRWLEGAAAAGCTVLIGDPGRRYF